MNTKGNLAQNIDIKASNRQIVIIFAMIMILIIALSATYTHVGLRNAEESSEKMSELVSGYVEGSLEAPIQSAMFATKVMSADGKLLAWLRNEKRRYRDVASEALLLEYLREYSEYSDCVYTFLASAQTNAYYSTETNGFYCEMSEDNPNNKWFYDFLEGKDDYMIDIKFDNENGKEEFYTYTDYKVRDSSGKIVAVVGLCFIVKDIIPDVSSDEPDGIKMQIWIMDQDGKAVYSSEYCDSREYNLFNDGFLKEYDSSVLNKEGKVLIRLKKAESCRIRYIGSADKYIVVHTSTEGIAGNERKNLIIMVIISVIVVFLVMLVVFRILNKYQREIIRYLTIQKDMLETDALTGVYSRHAYNSVLNSFGDMQEVPGELVVIELDINGLKAVNDNLGHEAGDELICGAAQCIQSVFGGHGKCYRVGGDEFVVVMNIDKNLLLPLIKKLDDAINSWRGQIAKSLSISYGYAAAADNEDISVEKLINYADKMMYENKKKYYRNHEHDRRNHESM